MTTFSLSGERTGAPWDVSNYPLYANVRGRGLVLLGISLTTLSMQTSGEMTGAPCDVSNFPLYANVRGRGLVLLGMYLTTLSMPTSGGEDWCSLGCI